MELNHLNWDDDEENIFIKQKKIDYLINLTQNWVKYFLELAKLSRIKGTNVLIWLDIKFI